MCDISLLMSNSCRTVRDYVRNRLKQLATFDTFPLLKAVCESMSAVSRRILIRWLLATLSVALVFATLGFTVYSLYTTSPAEGLEDIKFNELTNESIKGRVEFSRSLFQVTLLITAALWGLIIAKKDEAGIVFKDRPELVMFLCASLLLLSSLVDHSLYLHFVSRIYSIAGQAYYKEDPSMPDIFDPNINNFYIYQIWHLVSGFVVAIATLVSAHKLKEKT